MTGLKKLKLYETYKSASKMNDKLQDDKMDSSISNELMSIYVSLKRKMMEEEI